MLPRQGIRMGKSNPKYDLLYRVAVFRSGGYGLYYQDSYYFALLQLKSG